MPFTAPYCVAVSNTADDGSVPVICPARPVNAEKTAKGALKAQSFSLPRSSGLNRPMMSVIVAQNAPDGQCAVRFEQEEIPITTVC